MGKKGEKKRRLKKGKGSWNSKPNDFMLWLFSNQRKHEMERERERDKASCMASATMGKLALGRQFTSK